MAACIIHVDGSNCLSKDSKIRNGLGWALVAQHDDQDHELSGGYATLQHQRMNGAHEDVALVHALHYLHEHGFDPHETSIFCDDELFGYAPTYLAPGNYRGHHANLIVQRITWAAAFVGIADEVPKMMETLAQVRMHKVKGHQGHVYQERVDYLAKKQAHAAVGNITPILTFDAWLKKGLVVYTAPQVTDPDERARILDALGLTSEQELPPQLMPQAKVIHAPFVQHLFATQELDSSPAP